MHAIMFDVRTRCPVPGEARPCSKDDVGSSGYRRAIAADLPVRPKRPYGRPQLSDAQYHGDGIGDARSSIKATSIKTATFAPLGKRVAR